MPSAIANWLPVELLRFDLQRGHVLLADLDASGVAAGVRACGHGQAALVGGVRDQVDSDVEAGQRVSAPVHGDEGEQPVVK
jgi:hypothetical protein